MSNEIEMKRLADVEAVETVSDEASVLIVQDGEVKQTAKSNVGGAGGVVWMHFDNAAKIYRGMLADGDEKHVTQSEFEAALSGGVIMVDQGMSGGDFVGKGYGMVVGYAINDIMNVPFIQVGGGGYSLGKLRVVFATE